MQERGWADIGYHLGLEMVGQEFEILLGRPFDVKGAHCKAHGMNSRSIGLCIVGDYDHRPPPPDAWSLALLHVAGLCRLLGISPGKVYGHGEIDSHKTCPGLQFDMSAFRTQIRQIIGTS